MKTPLELLQTLLSNPTNIEHVRGLTTEDVTYVSLNFKNPELHKVLPWAGTNRGSQSIVDAFNGIGRVWETKAFEVIFSTDFQSCLMFGSVFCQTARLHHFSPFSLPSSVAHIDCQAIRQGCEPLPTLLYGARKPADS